MISQSNHWTPHPVSWYPGVMNLNEELDNLVNALDAFRARGLGWCVKDYDQTIEINDPNDGSRVLYRFQATPYGTAYWAVEQ